MLAGNFLPTAIFDFPIDIKPWHDHLAFNGDIIFSTTLEVTHVRGVRLARPVHIEVQINERDLQKYPTPTTRAEFIGHKLANALLSLSQFIEQLT